MEFNKDDLIETYAGVFWRVESVEPILGTLKVVAWKTGELVVIQFSDVMNRWVEKAL